MFMSLLVYELISLCGHIIPKLRYKGTTKNTHMQENKAESLSISKNCCNFAVANKFNTNTIDIL